MSLLDDMIVNDYTRHKVFPDKRKATAADLVAALQEEGGHEVTFFAPHIFPARDNPEYDLELPAGRYLVVRIDGETP